MRSTHMVEFETVQRLANQMTLGALLTVLRSEHGEFDLLSHWKQGEFHHDIVLRLQNVSVSLPGEIVVVATNCNGGVKEVLVFAEVPDRYALWHQRCPDNDEFEGRLPQVLGSARTQHWFDPCELLVPDARSELRPEYRTRQRGGGWTAKTKVG